MVAVRGHGSRTSSRSAVAVGLFSASAESLIQLHHAQQFVQFDLRHRELRLKQVPVGVKCVELRIYSAGKIIFGVYMGLNESWMQELSARRGR